MFFFALINAKECGVWWTNLSWSFIKGSDSKSLWKLCFSLSSFSWQKNGVQWCQGREQTKKQLDGNLCLQKGIVKYLSTVSKWKRSLEPTSPTSTLFWTGFPATLCIHSLVFHCQTHARNPPFFICPCLPTRPRNLCSDSL